MVKDNNFVVVVNIIVGLFAWWYNTQKLQEKIKQKSIYTFENFEKDDQAKFTQQSL
jgi:hypothetical protein